MNVHELHTIEDIIRNAKVLDAEDVHHVLSCLGKAMMVSTNFYKPMWADFVDELVILQRWLEEDMESEWEGE